MEGYKLYKYIIVPFSIGVGRVMIVVGIIGALIVPFLIPIAMEATFSFFGFDGRSGFFVGIGFILILCIMGIGSHE